MEANNIFTTFFAFLLSANLTLLISLYLKVSKIAIDLAKVIQKIGGIES